MSNRKKKVKPKKVDLLELSASKQARLLKEAKETLRQQLMAAKFCQSLAETERLIINGQTINFENDGLAGFTPEELTVP